MLPYRLRMIGGPMLRVFTTFDRYGRAFFTEPGSTLALYLDLSEWDLAFTSRSPQSPEVSPRHTYPEYSLMDNLLGHLDFAVRNFVPSFIPFCQMPLGVNSKQIITPTRSVQVSKYTFEHDLEDMPRTPHGTEDEEVQIALTYTPDPRQPLGIPRQQVMRKPVPIPKYSFESDLQDMEDMCNEPYQRDLRNERKELAKAKGQLRSLGYRESARETLRQIGASFRRLRTRQERK